MNMAGKSNGSSTESCASGLEHDSAYSSPSSSVYQTVPYQPNYPLTLNSLMCQICNNFFTAPRVLPCFHSFCSNCLDLFTKTADVHRCPVCRSEFVLPKNGVAGLTPDYAVTNIMKSFPWKQQCHSCKKQSSIAKCISCDNIMCSSCITMHSFVGCTDWKMDEFEDDAECLIHIKEALKYFCFSCNRPVCEECLSSDHVGHHSELISDVGEVLMSQMNKFVADWKNKISDVVNGIQFTDFSLLQLHTQYKESQRRVNDTYDDLIAIMIRQREEQLASLDLAFANLYQRLNEVNNVARESCERMSSLSEFCCRLLKYSSVPQSLMFKAGLELRVKRVSTIPHRASSSLQFLSDPKTVENCIKSFGYVCAQLDINGLPQLLPNKQLEGLSKIAEQILSLNLNDYSYYPTSPKFRDELLPFDLSHSNFPLKSNIPRLQITYSFKFGSYGKMEGQFSEPNGVALSHDNEIIIADTNNNRVQLFNGKGTFKFQFGCLSNSEGQLLFPNRVAVTATGEIVVTERAPTHQVQIYNQYGQFVRKFGSDVLQYPRAVAVDKNNFIIVVECKIMRVVIFDQFGKIVKKFVCSHNLQFPNGVAVHNNEIFISDNRSHCVMVYDYDGNFRRQIGQEGLTNYPIGVLISGDGEVLVADNHNNFNLTVFSPEGQFLTGYESRVKHSQCYDIAISSSGTLALTCKDYNVYLYQYPG